MKEEDDLYADLYSEETGVEKSGNDDVHDSIYDEDVKPKGITVKGASSASSSKSSFIPAATPSSSSGSSFIPADPNRQVNSSSVGIASNTSNPRSYISSTANSHIAPISRIETAPMTNLDGDNKAPSAYMGDQGYKQLLPHEMPDEGKLFVGGLNWETTDEGLKQYFSQFGKVNYCLIMRDPATQRSRGFAFLTLDDPKAVNSVMVKEHYLDGKIIDPKRAIPRQENIKTAKCFIGGIPSTATSESFKAYFERYGNVLDSTLMMDRETQKPRGYGFVTYDNEATVETLLMGDPLVMDGKIIEIKRATPRNADGTKRAGAATSDRRTNNENGSVVGSSTPSTAMGGGMDSNSMFMQGNAGYNNPMAAMMMGNPMFTAQQQQSSFDPQMMAQMFQQQNWGNANFNPMAFQQMMMGGMAGMGGGMGGMGGWGGGSPWMAGMNNMAGGGSMSPTGAVGSPLPGHSSGSNSINSRNMGTGQASAAGGMRSNDGNSAASNNRGRSNLQAPTSAGLPSRPRTNQEGRSPNAGRDYSREKSPERGSSSINNNNSNTRGGGGGNYNRDNRW
ncbi:hypothetical protein CBS101457_003480 [Exobasidium rhododendri]|nr:hypothetical protein CBS101457_003480 [Exobasidium rhododendri]